MALALTLGCGLYDRTAPLWDGTIRPDGIDLHFVPMEPGELFRRQARNAEFHVAEFSLSTYSILLARGDRRFVAVPVFPSRKFRHSEIFVHTGAGIEGPADLAGKRVGVMEYQQTAAVWMRAALHQDYGVPPEAMLWCFGGYNEPLAYSERVPVRLPPGVRTWTLPADRCLDDLLQTGEIDALMGPDLPRSFECGNPRVRRLFPDYPDVERDYYRRRGIFPIMHTLVVRRETYEEHPWVAASLFRAFAAAKALGLRRLASTGALFCALPWLTRHIEDMRQLMGPDPFAYGLETNRHCLETFLRLNLEQGLIERPLSADELFAPETQALTDPPPTAQA